MANLSRANGLRPVSYLSGAPWNGQVNMYLCPAADATAVFIGDAVKSGGTAGGAGVVVNGQDVHGMATIAQAAAGDAIRGVVVGFLPNQSDLSVLHRVASTNRIALVVDDPNVVFEIQEDSDGGAIAITAVGNNSDLVVGTGSATTGQSAMELDSSGVAAATAQLRILGFVKRPDNEVAATDSKLLVLINEHELKSTTGV